MPKAIRDVKISFLFGLEFMLLLEIGLLLSLDCFYLWLNLYIIIAPKWICALLKLAYFPSEDLSSTPGY